MTDQHEQPAERPEVPGARAARRARRIGGRSNPVTPPPPAADGTADAAEVPGPPPAGQPIAQPEPAAGSAHRPPWLPWLPSVVLAVVCLGFLGWGLFDSHGTWWAKGSSSVAGERGQVLAAAKGCMAAMNTYDYRKLDQAEAKGLACTTGTFTGQYKAAFEKLIKPQADKVQFTQTAQVTSAGIESVSGDGRQWVILVFGRLSTTNSQTGTKTPTLTPFSARVTMAPVGGKWLVANYQYAPAS